MHVVAPVLAAGKSTTCWTRQGESNSSARATPWNFGLISSSKLTGFCDPPTCRLF
jgi:hypothetical protein